MGQDKLVLVAEEEASLSSGSLRLYALPYGCVDLYNYDPLNRRCAVANQASIALFQKAGYQQCGHFQDWLLANEKYVDSIRMQKIL